MLADVPNVKLIHLLGWILNELHSESCFLPLEQLHEIYSLWKKVH